MKEKRRGVWPGPHPGADPDHIAGPVQARRILPRFLTAAFLLGGLSGPAPLQAQQPTLIQQAACGQNNITADVLERFIKAGKVTAEDIRREAPLAFQNCYIAPGDKVFRLLLPYLKDLEAIPIASKGALVRQDLSLVTHNTRHGPRGTVVFVPVTTPMERIGVLQAFSRDPAKALSSLTEFDIGDANCLGRSLLNSALHSRDPKLIAILIRRGLITKTTIVPLASRLTGWREPQPLFEAYLDIKRTLPPKSVVGQFTAFAMLKDTCPYYAMKKAGLTISPLKLIMRDIADRRDLSLARFIAPLCKLGQRMEPYGLHQLITAMKYDKDVALVDVALQCGADVTARSPRSGKSALAAALAYRKRTTLNQKLSARLIAAGAMP